MADLSVKIAGVEFKNPVIPASGVLAMVVNMRSFFRSQNWAALQQRALL